ncbi:hypothetical protein FOA52_012854 [Chlamydomonas sp. UWO 241]|nr:hypothetical protein FOA52_012854 [Chlamydomonas sp. UWO 241]
MRASSLHSGRPTARTGPRGAPPPSRLRVCLAVDLCAQQYGGRVRCLGLIPAGPSGATHSSSNSNSRHSSTRGVCRASAESSTAARSSPVIIATKEEDTIAAIVTGASQGSVSIIRLSGTDALATASRVFRPGGKFKFGWVPEDHKVHYGTAVDGDERAIDEVLLLSMASPRSYTCEDVVEIHTHGGGVCSKRVLQACIEAGARPARPGEFTLRAFLNGRLDLSQAESVLSLLESRTAAAADSALAGLRDGVGQAVSDMRDDCIALLAELEARLDFDEDMPAMDTARLSASVDGLQQRIEAALRTARQGSLLRQGLQIAIVGRPNVGKSSLLNAWTRTNRAIVTEIAGTTRDVLEAGLVVGGVPVTLLDTAGIRQSSDLVEQMGVERSRGAAAAADIVIMVIDGQAGWTPADAEIFTALWGDGPGTRSCAVKGLSLLVANKHDLAKGSAAGGTGGDGHGRTASNGNGNGSSSSGGVPTGSSGSTSGSGSESEEWTGGMEVERWPPAGSAAAAPSHGDAAAESGASSSGGGGGGGGGGLRATGELLLPVMCRETFGQVVYTSATTREGLDSLDAGVLRLVGAPQLAAGGISWAVNERQAEALVRAHEALMRCRESVRQELPIDFWTIDLREAVLVLGEVSGDEVTEQILDSVFSRFCIGK